MKLLQLKIILASCYIFSMLTNDILIFKKLDGYSEPNVLLAQSQTMFYQATLLSTIYYDT